MRDWRRVRVPASSANLGPGFDGLALAAGMYLDCRFRESNELQIRASGRDAEEISSGEHNLIWRAAVHCGARNPIELEIFNDIPLGKGLGSSAAAVTAGVVIASVLGNCGWDRARVLEESARIEGHPDNVAACVFGGVTASAADAAGRARAVRIPLHENFRIGVVIPDFRLPTSKSRGDRSAFPEALEDRMHQPYRYRLVPGLEEITRLRASGLLGCALSGAGPSLLVFYERGSDSVCDIVAEAFAEHGHKCEIWRGEIPQNGYEVS